MSIIIKKLVEFTEDEQFMSLHLYCVNNEKADTEICNDIISYKNAT